MGKCNRCLIVAALAASLGAAEPPVPAVAEMTFVVDTVDDLSTLDNCTAAAGDCSLRGAISAANASGSSAARSSRSRASAARGCGS